MPAVHYYLGRPARVWISAHSRRSPARQARNGSGRVHSGIPGQPGGLLARQRIAIARFGADVAAAGGIGPALAAGLEPADYPVVPGGVPQAWERARVYLGLCERYQELYQAQVAELHLLMATAPGCSLPLSHRRPPTDPLTNTHTGHISLISGAARRSDAYDPPVMHIGGSSAGPHEGWPRSVTAGALPSGSRKVSYLRLGVHAQLTAAKPRAADPALGELPPLAQHDLRMPVGL
jgi:hypothetical protein